MELLDTLDFDKAGGLMTALAQDAESGEILMLAQMNPDAFQRSLETGEVAYWGRSRNKPWHKGEESGNVQRIRETFIDCDGEAVVFKIDEVGGAACHTGRRSCFFRRVDRTGVEDVGVQVFDPKEVYRK